MRKTSPKKGRRRLKRYGRKCFYCGKQLGKRDITLDHVLPKALGGRLSKGNVVAACLECNQAKGMMDLEAYRAHLSIELPQGERVTFAGELN